MIEALFCFTNSGTFPAIASSYLRVKKILILRTQRSIHRQLITLNISVTNKHKHSHASCRRIYLNICFNLFAITILIATAAQHKPKKNDWVMERLLEKVKAVKQSCYEAMDTSGEIIKGRRIDNSMSNDFYFDFFNTYTTYHRTGYI